VSRIDPASAYRRPATVPGLLRLDSNEGVLPSPALLGDQLDQMGGRRHEREAVQEDAARGEDVGVRGANGIGKASALTPEDEHVVRSKATATSTRR